MGERVPSPTIQLTSPATTPSCCCSPHLLPVYPLPWRLPIARSQPGWPEGNLAAGRLRRGAQLASLAHHRSSLLPLPSLPHRLAEARWPPPSPSSPSPPSRPTPRPCPSSTARPPRSSTAGGSTCVRPLPPSLLPSPSISLLLPGMLPSSRWSRPSLTSSLFFTRSSRILRPPGAPRRPRRASSPVPLSSLLALLRRRTPKLTLCSVTPRPVRAGGRRVDPADVCRRAPDGRDDARARRRASPSPPLSPHSPLARPSPTRALTPLPPCARTQGLTKDGHLVVWHDEVITADKCADTAPAVEGDGQWPYVGQNVANLTLAQVQTLGPSLSLPPSSFLLLASCR